MKLPLICPEKECCRGKKECTTGKGLPKIVLAGSPNVGKINYGQEIEPYISEIEKLLETAEKTRMPECRSENYHSFLDGAQKKGKDLTSGYKKHGDFAETDSNGHPARYACHSAQKLPFISL